ncbi:MAG: hypothetical protein ACOYOU_14380, partial [Kiritimatiellia bacterium]
MARQSNNGGTEDGGETYAERAQRARQMRKQAPAVDVRGTLMIVQKSLMRQVAEFRDKAPPEKVMH